MSSKNILFFCTVFLMGMGLGYFLNQYSKYLAPLNFSDQKCQNLKDNLTTFTQRDLEDYIRLKKSEDKYTQADELIGKMLLILLADLGIQASSLQIQYAKAATRQPFENPIGLNQSKIQKISQTIERPLRNETPSGPWKGDLLWIKSESKLQTIRDNQELDSFLKETRIGDFSRHLNQSSVMKQPDMHLSGCFEGEVNFQDGSNILWLMKMETAFNSDSANASDSDGITGRSLVELSENGQTHSRTSGSGTLKAFRKFDNQSSAIVVEASDSIYFQLYYLSDRDGFVGNMYQKVDISKFQFKATVSLVRGRNCR